MRPTALLYLDDAYATRFEAQVLDLAEHAAILDRSLFYPRGGGQAADLGTLEAYGERFRVIAVEKRGDMVFHTIDGRLPPLGARVRGEIEWEHRYRMMRTHTAIHVLCGIVYHEYGVTVTGNQMYPDRARVDLSLPDLDAERVAGLERRANDAIAAGYPVRARWLPRQEADLRPELIRTRINLVPAHIDPIRVVEIVGLDAQTDGGTHVNNTVEIGGIRVTRTENKGRENRRIEFVLRDPAVT